MEWSYSDSSNSSSLSNSFSVSLRPSPSTISANSDHRSSAALFKDEEERSYLHKALQDHATTSPQRRDRSRSRSPSRRDDTRRSSSECPTPPSSPTSSRSENHRHYRSRREVGKDDRIPIQPRAMGAAIRGDYYRPYYHERRPSNRYNDLDNPRDRRPRCTSWKEEVAAMAMRLTNEAANKMRKIRTYDDLVTTQPCPPPARPCPKVDLYRISAGYSSIRRASRHNHEPLRLSHSTKLLNDPMEDGEVREGHQVGSQHDVAMEHVEEVQTLSDAMDLEEMSVASAQSDLIEGVKKVVLS